MVSIKEKRIIMAKDSLIHLELKDNPRRCERNVASTDFGDIFVLDLAVEKSHRLYMLIM